ncbi:MAG: molybdenum cofactor guanylyltransferase MobA [Alphaproteobacteria bacterium]|jgi:molybdopterin-guanine dinucleotide biosynthesis protein A|nr:molybdenum cofactor guanylyltransferase MobA [Alphaproteobacteria bacterium]
MAVVGAILAGGLARRLGGGDKPLRLLAGRPLLAHVAERLRPQVDRLILNANGDPARFATFGIEVVPDSVPGNPGPLAGILACLETATDADWVVTVPGDAPFLPADLAMRLVAAGPAAASSRGRRHPVIGAWRPGQARRLAELLASGERRVGVFAADAGVVEWPAEPVDPFMNLNEPADFAAAEALITASAGYGRG